MKEFLTNACGYFSSIPPAQHVFMRNDDTVCLTHTLRNRLPVIGSEAAKVDQFYIDTRIAVQLFRSLQCPRHHRTVSNHGQFPARTDDLCFAKRDAVIRSGVGGPAVCLAV